jgi:acyl-ACP thioesterase
MQISDSNVFSHDMRVRCYEQDFKTRLRAGEVFNWFQETAGGHCRLRKVAIEDIIPLGYTWIIHRYKVVVHKMPVYEQECKVSTWAQPKRDLISIRDFKIESQSGERLVSATTQWALIELATQRPAKLSAAIPDFKACTDRALDEDLKPIKIPEDAPLVDTFQVSAAAWHIDVNNHVNNSVYVFWMYDSIYARIKATPVLREVEVNYKKQAFFGQKIDLKCFSPSAGVYYHDIVLHDTGETLAVIRSLWDKEA